jgi:hypothetical protein
MAQGMSFFQFSMFRNPIVFSSDDNTNTSESCSAGDPLDVVGSIIIDRDIARLEESIRALKSHRNELSPISRLPAEILCNIFSLSILWNPESWTNFSQVSQHWRSLALNAPELWTDIPLSYPRWAQEMLIRSKMAKLTIRSGLSFETSNPKTIETVRSCLHEMNRVEEINLSVIPELILEEIFRDLPKSAPQLHTLRIESCWPHFTGTAFSIHEDFLYDTERLQHVALFNCKISWDSRLLTGLTRLTLEVEDSLKTNSSINQFLHALQRMPALTDFHLNDSTSDDLEGSSTYPVVDLPCLRVLSISSGVGALTAILRHITFPHSAILNLTCKEYQSSQIDFSNFLSVLATKFLSSLVIRSLSVQVLDDDQTNGLEFHLWTTAIIQDCFPSSLMPQPQSQLVLTWPSPQPHNHVKALTCAFDAMSLPFLTKLQLSTLENIDSQTWVDTFGKLPLLERVCVQSDAAPLFLEALVYKTKAAEESITAYRDVSFPKLRYIHLERTDFDGTLFNMLLDCLMERYERNAEVQVLRLDNCYGILSDDVEGLKGIVDVIWDGVEQEISTYMYHDSEEDDVQVWTLETECQLLFQNFFAA